MRSKPESRLSHEYVRFLIRTNRGVDSGVSMMISNHSAERHSGISGNYPFFCVGKHTIYQKNNFLI
jgi:hypothetical protein